VRNPAATRPWQHVLEPLSGYLWLAALLANPRRSKVAPTLLASAFNFGPGHESNRTVAELVAEVLKHWPGRWEDKSDPKAVHEAGLLQLATDKAHALLGWSPVWSFADAVEQTVAWYVAANREKRSVAMADLMRGQIGKYCADAASQELPWAGTAA
jgi:CDP-glucose 4,6-dehydratase